MTVIRTEGDPIMVMRAPSINVNLVCKARGDLQVDDVVYDHGAEKFFKVTRLFVHVGHGAVISVEGCYKDGSPARWSFNDFSGANCFVAAKH